MNQVFAHFKKYWPSASEPELETDENPGPEHDGGDDQVEDQEEPGMESDVDDLELAEALGVPAHCTEHLTPRKMHPPQRMMALSPSLLKPRAYSHHPDFQLLIGIFEFRSWKGRFALSNSSSLICFSRGYQVLKLSLPCDKSFCVGLGVVALPRQNLLLQGNF